MHIRQEAPGLVVLLDRAEDPDAVSAAARRLGVTAGLAADLLECSRERRRCSIKGDGDATLQFGAIQVAGDSTVVGIAVSKPVRADGGGTRLWVVWRQLTMVLTGGRWTVEKDEVVAIS